MVVQFATEPWVLFSVTTQALMLCFIAKSSIENRALKEHWGILMFVFGLIGLETALGLLSGIGLVIVLQLSK